MAGVLELMWFDLDDAERARRRPWLTEAELARADRYVTPLHGARFIAARSTLRELLAQRLGCHPAQVRFEYGAKGKPALPGLPFHFNLSHSGNYALVGIHPESELGVDIEGERPSIQGPGIARRFFTAREAAWLDGHAPAAQPHAFCRLWTCKEAWMKAEGQGMALPLNQVEVTFPSSGAVLRELTPPREWYVRELELTPGYCAAVVMARAPESIRVARLPRATSSLPAP